MAEAPRRRRRKQERVEGTQLMDVAREAFVRHVALEKWRDVADVRETVGLEWDAAAADAGVFTERWPYHEVWLRHWREAVLPATATPDAGAIFAAIERAVTAAVEDERHLRIERGDRPFEEHPDFKHFLDDAFRKILSEGAAMLEPPGHGQPDAG